MRYFITGGAGFIGSHLTGQLLEQGHSVVVLDDLSTGTLENLASVGSHQNFQFHQGSILERKLVQYLVSESDYVIHLAAAVGVRRILTDPLTSLKVNVDGSDIVLGACADHARPVFLASTSETYGKNDSDALCEDSDSVIGPTALSRWSYATAKKLDEFLGLAYGTTRGIPVIVTRFFNIVGPRQSARYGMVLPAFVRAALTGSPIHVFGDGLQTRNFTYIEDCLDAMQRLLRNPLAAGRVFNIGGAEEISILELAQRVKAAAQSSSRIELVPYGEAYPEGGYEDMRRRVPCICRIEALTGWRPTMNVDEIIRKTIAYERHRRDAEWHATADPALVEAPHA